ncbi:unnamed protein product [Rhizophagus irregularis]|nr:unnamed protein product [Rhizophagus irregularis]
MKRYFSSVETQPPAKGKNKQCEPSCEASSSEKPDSSKPSALQLPSLLIKDSPSELNDYGSHLSNTSAKEIEEAIVYVIEKALCEEIRNSNNWKNLLHFGSDGAATLIGTKTGSFRRMQNLKMIQETLEEQDCKEFTPDIGFDIKIHLDTTYDAITAQFIGFDGSYGTHLQKYVQDYNILSENLPSFIKSFSEAIINSIKSRFPQSDLYHSFRIFDPKLLPIKENELGNYGNDDIK